MPSYSVFMCVCVCAGEGGGSVSDGGAKGVLPTGTGSSLVYCTCTEFSKPS